MFYHRPSCVTRRPINPVLAATDDFVAPLGRSLLNRKNDNRRAWAPQMWPLALRAALVQYIYGVRRGIFFHNFIFIFKKHAERAKIVK